MANDAKKILVRIGTGEEVSLTSNSPDIDSLISAVVDARDGFNADEISVSCPDDENFDCDGFKDILVKLSQEFIDSINREHEGLRNAIEQIEARTSEGN